MGQTSGLELQSILCESSESTKGSFSIAGETVFWSEIYHSFATIINCKPVIRYLIVAKALSYLTHIIEVDFLSY